MKHNQYEPINVLLADDDGDDCHFFKNALSQIDMRTNLTCVQDGEELMRYLVNTNNKLPDVLFLDINMPRKNGLECLAEIKIHRELAHLPIIIISTSIEPDVVNRLYTDGAKYFIRKPPEFSQFKNIIFQTLTLIKKGNIPQTKRENFVITLQDGTVALGNAEL